MASRRRWVTHRVPWIVFGAAVAVLLFGAWLRRHTLDDSFINYRIVRQIQAGNGPVFNMGERVEAFTSPLWLGVLTVTDWILPVRLEWIGMIGGMLAGAAGLVAAGLGARHLHRVVDDADPHDGTRTGTNVLVPLGAVVLAVFPPIYRLIATGLEDGLSVAWLGGSVLVLGRWAVGEKRLGLWSAFWIGLGVLVRPDMAPFCGAFLLAVLVGDRAHGWRSNARMVACAVALPVATEVLRMGYFGVLTPNTAIAKSAHLSRWDLGWDYLLDTMNPYGFWIPVAIVVLAGYVPVLRRLRHTGRTPRDVRRALVMAAFGVGAITCACYIVRIGGDYMATRLLLPAIFGFVAPTAFVNWRVRPGLNLGTAVAGVAVAWVLVCGLFLRTPSDSRAVLFEPEIAVTLDDFTATLPGQILTEVEPGSVHYMNRLLPHASARGDTPIVVELGVGKAGYGLPTDVYVLDGLGLANPMAAHQELRRRGWTGHEKLLTQPWIAALSTAPGSDVRESEFPRPAPLKHHGIVAAIPRQDDPQGRSFSARVATARGVLECRTVERFRESYGAPMSWSRFRSNLTGSFTNQRLVIPGEPADAADALCSPTERDRIAEQVAAAD